MSSPDKNITSVLKEHRLFPPSEAFAKAAQISAAEHARLTEWAKRDPDGFWAEQARSLHWFKTWDKVLDW
jgi:acetyl-CoA synthetase